MSTLGEALEEALIAAGQSIIRLCGGTPANPLPVAPIISIDQPKIVLVRNANYQPQGHRLRVRLDVSHHFTGTGTLTCNHPAEIELFDSDGNALALPLAVTADELNDTKVVYVQGVTPSADMNVTTLSLALTPGGEPVKDSPATDNLTCVQVQLDLAVYKAAPGGGDPAPLGEGAKRNPGRNLHLQDERNYAGRAMLTVHKARPHTYTGEVVLRGIENRLTTYPYAEEVPGPNQHPNPATLSTPNATIPATGLKLWVEGSDYSRGVRDTGFTCEISDLPRREGDRVNITVVRAVLDVYQSRRRAGRDPDEIEQANKMTPGRFLHLQVAGNFQGLAKVRARKVDPPDWDGWLEILFCDAADGSTPSARARLMSLETAGAAQANPVRVHHTAATPAAGEVRWAEGAAVSGGLRDTQLRLRIEDAEGAADRANFTVANFTRIRATIKPTPQLTPGNAAAMGIALPANHTFDATAYDEALAGNPPLVLMRNAQPDTELEVTAAPAGLPIAWDAPRNSTDHGDLGDEDDIPTVTVQADVTKAILNANERGWFRVRPYIDCNGSGSYSAGEPSMPLNLILADARVTNDRSAAQRANLVTNLVAGGFSVRNGAWAALPGGLAGAGMAMDLVMEVTGGGPVGRDGLDMVFAGLVNCLSNVEITATYQDNTVAPPTNHTLINRYVSNGAAAAGVFGTKPLFTGAVGEAAPAVLTFPLLDSGRPGAGQGGETATMTSSTLSPPVNLAVGQEYVVQCIDSPGRGFPLNHPVNGAAVLVSVSYLQQFVANFCFWTNVSRNIGATGDPADRVYSVLRIRPWEVEGVWDIDVAAMTYRATTRHTISSSWWSRRTVRPIGRAQDHGIEVRPPSGIGNALAWDGR